MPDMIDLMTNLHSTIFKLILKKMQDKKFRVLFTFYYI